MVTISAELVGKFTHILTGKFLLNRSIILNNIEHHMKKNLNIYQSKNNIRNLENTCKNVTILLNHEYLCHLSEGKANHE